MNRAVQLAIEKMTQGHGGPFGAVVVKDGKIIAEGFNSVTSLNDPTAHAEVQAIRKACQVLGSYQLDGCELYTSCEPCPMCLGAIYWARPQRVFYACTRKDAAEAGFDDDLIYREIAVSPESRTIQMVQVGREGALQAFDAWRLKIDKTPY